MEVLLLIDKFDDLLRDAKPARLGARVRVHRREAFALLDEMRAVVPEEIRHARSITRERDGMLAEARREAERALAEARDERSRLVGSGAVARAAEHRAGRALESARARARQIRLGSEDYADEILASVETGLGRLAPPRTARSAAHRSWSNGFLTFE